MIGRLKAFIHPSGNVAAPGNLPPIHKRFVPKSLQLEPNPKCPITVQPCVTDKEFRHASPRSRCNRAILADAGSGRNGHIEHDCKRAVTDNGVSSMREMSPKRNHPELRI